MRPAAQEHLLSGAALHLRVQAEVADTNLATWLMTGEKYVGP